MDTGRSREGQPGRRGRLLGLKALVTFAFIGLIVWIVPWGELWSAARDFDPRVWLGVWVGFLTAHLVGAMKWRISVRLGKANLGVVDAIRCYWAGLFANLCLPSIVGGDALRAILAGRVTRRFEAVVFGSLADRLIDVAALLALCAAGAALSQQTVPGWAGNVILVGFALALAGGLVLVPFVLRRRISRWPPRLRRTIARAMVAARRLARRPGVALRIFALSVGIQSSFVFMNVWLGSALGIDLPLAFWFLAWPLAKIASLAPISLNGFGVREAALAGILNLNGVGFDQGVLVSILWQTVLIAGGLLGGVLWFLLGRRSGSPSTRGDLIRELRSVESERA